MDRQRDKRRSGRPGNPGVLATLPWAAVLLFALLTLLLAPAPRVAAGPGGPRLPQSLSGPPKLAQQACTRCHREQGHFSPFHDPALIGCTSCHGGNGTATAKAAAHQGMEPFPGRVATAQRSCGQANCHEAQVNDLRHSIMTTANGMIELTRGIFGAEAEAGRGLLPAQRLGRQGVDSYLRKLCVSCHLANRRRHPDQSVASSVLDRGGGCSACHLETHASPSSMGETPPERDVRTGAHPTLSVRIPDERCFGCHSRSSRISLNYVGLAEVDALDAKRAQDFGHLQDGRLVERRLPDLHSRAGLSCTDCHTAAGVMGTGQPVTRLAQQIDVRCEDCHAPTLRTKPVGRLTGRELRMPGLMGWTNPDFLRGRVVVTHRRGTPMWNVFHADGKRLLRLGATGREVPIPVLKHGRAHDLKGHERLSCTACHDTWAPQCDGCHIGYDPKARQWDHLEKRETPGRWIETRWHIRNGSPALGVGADGQIWPFVPGMNLQADLPGRSRPLRSRRYTRIVPHTTQRAGRSCESCHGSEQALGVITGQAVAPGNPALRAPIGWVPKGATQAAPGLRAGERSLNRGERRRVRRVGQCLACHPGTSRIYADFRASLAAIAGQHPHPVRDSRAPPR